MEQRYCLSCMRKYTEAEEVCPVCGYHHGKEEWPPYALRPGTTLHDGKYLVGKLLGQGGFGLTYVGLETVLGLKVAIKEYYPQTQVSRVQGGSEILWHSVSDGGHAGRESFLKEARRMAMVDSIPGIVQVREVFYQNSTAYIVMNFIEGETLKNRLMRTGVMTPSTCVSLLNPVMEAMEKAHKAGLVHRDISPDNIMIDRNGQVWLLDMGAAKEIERGSSNPSQLVVKHGFSPPEQERGEGIGPWTDVYAMSATIYYCLTGEMVPDALTRLTKLMEGKDLLSFPKGIPAKTASVLTRGLALQTKDRIQTMRELKAEINDIPPDPKPFPKLIAVIASVAAVAGIAALCYVQHWGPFGKKIELTPTPAPIVSSAPSVIPASVPTPSESPASAATATPPATPASSPTPSATNTPSPPTPSPTSDATVTVVNYENGVYEGEIKDGKRNGQGTMTYTNGNVYVGEWVDDQRSGQGTLKGSNGNVYEGEWANDKMNGTGTFTAVDGRTYYGEYVEGKRIGKGTFTWPDGRVYEGEWTDDKRTGQGTMTWPDGRVYEGEWTDDKLTGQGTMTYADGSVYVGEWVDGQRSGQGKYTWKSGHVYEGEWTDDKATGQGVMIYPSKNVYEGEMKDGKRNGQGTMTYADGRVETGIWEDDKLVELQPSAASVPSSDEGSVIDLSDDEDSLVAAGNEYYSNGEYEKAVESYIKASAKGNAKAQNNLGYCYEMGVGTEKDEKRAVQLYTLSANQENAIGQYNLAGCYKNGKGVEKDIEKATEWYTKAAEQGYEKAKEALSQFTSDTSVTVVNYENGDVYEGELKDGKRNGQGTMTYTDGGVYEGEWVDGQKSGQGKYTWADSTEEAPRYYAGQWLNDKRHGQGTQYSDGGVYEGEWVDGQYNGQGTYTWADNTEEAPHYYAGQWLNGKRHGKGTQYYSDGRVESGEWKDGVFVQSESTSVPTPTPVPTQSGTPSPQAGNTSQQTVPLKSANIGDVVILGKYEQDDDISNGKEDIEWLVLRRSTVGMLLVSRNILDYKMYNNADIYLTWKKSDLHTWLTQTFFYSAFTYEEQQKVADWIVEADKNPEYDTDPGSDTQDFVFLLSAAEAEEYFKSDEARKSSPTPYALARRSYSGDSQDTWWLRTPGETSDYAAFVDDDGSILYQGAPVDYNYGIRPALWIKLSSIE